MCLDLAARIQLSDSGRKDKCLRTGCSRFVYPITNMYAVHRNITGLEFNADGVRVDIFTAAVSPDTRSHLTRDLRLLYR